MLNKQMEIPSYKNDLDFLFHKYKEEIETKFKSFFKYKDPVKTNLLLNKEKIHTVCNDLLDANEMNKFKVLNFYSVRF